ncbi:MAG: hypothetical protein KJP02_06225 [Octadecabacter sp.]|nr:hypothetical protein [Octadecabacter sp.]
MAKSSKKKVDQTKAEVEPAETAGATIDVVPSAENEAKLDEGTVDQAEMDVDGARSSGEDNVVDAHHEDHVDDNTDDVAPDDDTKLTEANVAEEASVEDHSPSEAAEREPAPVQRSNGGFFPVLLGGVAAGAIGFGIGQYDPSGNMDVDVDALIAEQAARIVALEDQIAAADIEPLMAQVAEIETTLDTRLAGLAAQVEAGADATETRLSELERRPNADGTLSEVALSAYQEELEALRAELDAQKQDVTALAAQAQADLEAARAESATLEQQAIATAQAAAARAAINRIAAAAETGAPFAAALSDPSLEGIEIPPALVEVSEAGVPTTAALATAFPDAARAALAAARSEGQSDDAGGLGGFLRNQFDVRSTTPQEGPGADAVLSRAEAAIKGGRVADALAEIEALPEVARAAMTEWTAQAQSRSDALAAIASLSETLNSN